jgi:hypothetical protein
LNTPLGEKSAIRGVSQSVPLPTENAQDASPG